MRGRLFCGATLALFALPYPVLAQDNSAAAPVSVAAATGNGQVFTPEFFARFAPRTARDMLNNLPGFSISSSDQGRGLGQANTNVLINGERLALKSESVEDRLAKISASKVVRIELVDAGSLGIPGLSGQVANIFTREGGLTGQFRWDTRFRPGYVEPRWWGGNASISGTSGDIEYTLALENPGGTGSTKGWTEILRPDGVQTERRYSHLRNTNNYPKVSSTLKWDGPGSSVANFNASYERGYFDLRDDELRIRSDGRRIVKLYDPRERTYSYEIGGDFEFALGPGRLKLIGLESYEHSRYGEDFVLTPEGGGAAEGSRYRSVSESGEHIGRGEYSWKMLGGEWELAAEAAFNRYRGTAEIYELDAAGGFTEIPFPEGTGGVTEDRYEAILTHNRRLGSNLTLQIGMGGEVSTLAQTGSRGLTRTFHRPKGSATLSWTPQKGLDVSLKIARVVGQLSFGDFLAEVDLDEGNGNAGNIQLKPEQSWQAELQIKKDFGAWGSANLKLMADWYQDYIDWIPLPGGLETRGNIDKATLYGFDFTGTINFDPIGFKGAKLDFRANLDRPSIRDPLTGAKRQFSDWNDTYVSADFRHDIPSSSWAWGAGFELYGHGPDYRLRETREDYEGPIYTSAFIENKDVFGLTVRASVFNLTNGRHIVHRVFYDGPRNASPVLFREETDESVGLIYQVSVRGTF